MQIDLVTPFPGMVTGFFEESMMKRAASLGCVSFRFVNPRDFTTDLHRTVDDRPFGGGPGMIMKPEPLFAAVESVKTARSRVLLMTPVGRPFRQADARRLSREDHLVFICGHYEGVDERVREALVDEAISIGDYVLTNGVLAAAVVADAVVRLLPGVLGAGDEAADDESFAGSGLEYPQYTRPAAFRDMPVPEVLLSGNHAAIRQWREEQSLARTRAIRPDLLGDREESA